MRACTLLVILSLIFYNCSATQVREHYDEYDGFWNYTLGRSKNYVDPMLEPKNGKIVEEKHPYYLGFWTPEIIFNPQGGIYYPDMIVEVLGKDKRGNLQRKFYNTADLHIIKDEALRRKILDKRIFAFRQFHAGLLEFILPYREIASAINGDKVTQPYANIFCGTMYLTIAIPMLVAKLFFYPVHDVFKTVIIPVAGVYYTVQAFEDDEEEE